MTWLPEGDYQFVPNLTVPDGETYTGLVDQYERPIVRQFQIGFLVYGPRSHSELEEKSATSKIPIVRGENEGYIKTREPKSSATTGTE